MNVQWICCELSSVKIPIFSGFLVQYCISWSRREKGEISVGLFYCYNTLCLHVTNQQQSIKFNWSKPKSFLQFQPYRVSFLIINTKGISRIINTTSKQIKKEFWNWN
jgi:hypothetical protein